MMEFQLINTQTGNKERVYAADGQTLRFYCCGPTVYGPAHIGNFRTFTIQDVFRRTAETLGLKTLHVRNVTDFDDKTIRTSQQEGKSLVDFTNHWKAKFHADCEALNNLPPHIEPSALAHIREQVELIQGLVDKGYAYQAKDQSVYFRISAFESYGKLSGL
ncbi:MAG: cysteine--tRNA ligase, partial [Puniceicoccaceae bacterium]